jgi:hypothetical protein
MKNKRGTAMTEQENDQEKTRHTDAAKALNSIAENHEKIKVEIRKGLRHNHHEKQTYLIGPATGAITQPGGGLGVGGRATLMTYQNRNT